MSTIYKQGEHLLNEIVETKLLNDSISFWNLGQAGILLKGRDMDGVICIDPYLSISIEEDAPGTEFKRAFPPVIEPDLLQDLDGLLVTHNHGDHLDLITIKKVATVSKNIRFVVPAPFESFLHEQIESSNILAARDGESLLIEGFTITPVPAAHTAYEVDSLGDYTALGYFIEVNGVRIFHSGDTIVTKELIEKVKEFKPHVAFLPINGADYFRTSRNIVGNMSFREAADFAVTVGVDMIIPIHYDLFPNNRENPAYFVDYLFSRYPNQKFHMMVPGERFIYHK